MTDAQRMDWLEAGGIDRIICHKGHGAILRFGVRLNIGAPKVEWRYTDRFKTLREACDYGITNPLISP